MTRWVLAAGAAAIALAAPAIGEKGGHDGGSGKAAERQSGHQAGQPRGGGGERGAFKADGQKAERRVERRAERQSERLTKRSEGGHDTTARDLRSDERSARKSARRDESRVKLDDRSDGEDFGRSDDFDDDRRDRGRFADGGSRHGRGVGCPPGLATKDNGCLPPGLARKLDIGDRLDGNDYSSAFMPSEYRDLYRDTPDYYYRADQGYIYRVDRDNDLVAGLIPLLGGGFGVGQTLPAGYDFYNVPSQYRSLYPEQDDYYHRYGDNAIYRVDRSTNLIDSVAALMAGDLAVGSPLPLGYDAYNVPLQYRDRYADSPDSWYRYNDGNIYQVDPTTRLIQAVISAIV